ncbi:unnamed protein product [Lota lota]
MDTLQSFTLQSFTPRAPGRPETGGGGWGARCGGAAKPAICPESNALPALTFFLLHYSTEEGVGLCEVFVLPAPPLPTDYPEDYSFLPAARPGNPQLRRRGMADVFEAP